ncbi:MAG: hypothetical protein JNK74_14850 [Candidatus Hydrogenedentes bacterium]|nr:hypothetical protein [Candidatus Hydrogenedentota bacterium]
MRSLFGLTMLSILALAGCAKEEAPPEAVPVEVPPKTVSEIVGEYSAALQPLFAGAQAGSGFAYGAADPIISQFTTLRSQNSNPKEINEPAASAQIEEQVANHVKIAKDAEEWYALDGLLKLHATLNPTSQRYQPLRRKTDLMMERPLVKCTGFATIDKDDLMAFLDVMDPKTSQITSVRVREGEEFYPDAEGKSILRLVKVIGAQSGLELEYMRLPGETWEIPGPENR